MHADKNELAFAELIQFLDDKTLHLIMRDAPDNGRKALSILREHFRPKGKQRIISLYTSLTRLEKSSSETVTDFVIRAETLSCALMETGENISDELF